MSRYTDWSQVKEDLNDQRHQPPYVSEGDIWWASIGLNIGSEIYGKNTLFLRPVIIYKKFSRGFYLVIPATSKSKSSTWFIPYTQKGLVYSACLHQARAIDHRRLINKIGTLDKMDWMRVRQGFKDLYI